MPRLLIKLTDRKTEKAVFVSPVHVVSVYVDSDGRTGVLTTPGVAYLVAETPEEIADRVTAIFTDGPDTAEPPAPTS